MVYDYTIKVSTRFLPLFWRCFRVRAHSNETVGNTTRLVLTKHDGAIVCLPGLESRHVKLGKDFQECRVREAHEQADLQVAEQDRAAREREVAERAVAEYRMAEQMRLQAVRHTEPAQNPYPAGPQQLASIRAQQGR